ncbi:MAG TPA: serine/threonine-protein kinase [Acidobacteriaceae bacterium]|nr:serine/threonine-protein kinase [Acidobacteriaceae bacterium]
MKPITEIEVGRELDHYRIDAFVADSGMASIYRATDMRDGREVAIKIPHMSLEQDPVRAERFKREEDIGTSLHHPNVMQIFSDDHRSRTYMVMDWCHGRLLRQILNEEGKLAPERAIKITLGILRALDYIHNRGVVHRDLKPENIMVDDQDNIKLIDFGIASLEGAKRITYTGYTQALGTPEYIAPEQVQGKRGDARADLYAVGIMLYEMLSGKTPFTGPSPLAVMNDRLINHPLPPRVAEPSITPQLQEVLYRAIEREPKNRYPSAHAFALDLEHLDQVGVADRTELTKWKKPKGQGSHKVLLYSVLALIPILLFLAMLFLSRHHG